MSGTYTHDPADEPVDCAMAVLNELAGARLADPAATLEHGERAVLALQQALDEARRYARWFRHLGTEQPAVDTLAAQHGLPGWLEQPWASWDDPGPLP